MSPLDRNRAKAAHRLSDMSGALPTVEYRCPEGTRLQAFPIDLGAGSYLHVEIHMLMGRVVWFVLAQWFQPDPDLAPVRIARIDCCRNSVHEHRYNADDEDVLDHRIITDLTQGDPAERVNETFSSAYDLAIDNWEKNLDLWRAS